MDKTFSPIRQTTEELYVVGDELNRRAARDGSGLQAALVLTPCACATRATDVPLDQGSFDDPSLLRYRPALPFECLSTLFASLIAASATG